MASLNLGRDLLLFPGCQGKCQTPAGGIGAETTGKPLDSPVWSLYEQSASGASGSSFSYLLPSPGVHIECTDVRFGLEEVPQGLVYVLILLAVITLSVLFRLPEAESEHSIRLCLRVEDDFILEAILFLQNGHAFFIDSVGEFFRIFRVCW